MKKFLLFQYEELEGWPEERRDHSSIVFFDEKDTRFMIDLVPEAPDEYMEGYLHNVKCGDYSGVAYTQFSDKAYTDLPGGEDLEFKMVRHFIVLKHFNFLVEITSKQDSKYSLKDLHDILEEFMENLTCSKDKR